MGQGVRRAAVTAAALAAALAIPAAPASADDAELHLVAMRAPGASAYNGVGAAIYRAVLQARQDQALAAVGAPTPVYRWTTALSGVAVQLTAEQARALVDLPDVASVERDEVRPLASVPGHQALSRAASTGSGGRGVVIGVVDSGIRTDSPVFAPVPALGPLPAGFRGDCDELSATLCNDKIVAAQAFVEGFGRGRISSASSLSARDDSGHGSIVASIAAGNSGVSVLVGDDDLGTYSGAAPLARLAVYKACWTAPDPADDGCSTADLVTAIDRATADGVDVLNLSVGGAAGIDTVERALLGATEGGVLVAAAAGNAGDTGHAAHATPWVTTVGAAAARVSGGEVALPDGTTWSGAMAARQTVTAPLVVGADIPAVSADAADAAACLPGSLDAARARGRIVLCERGRIGRVDKSRAVALADAVGMVLADPGSRDLHADFHAVPTVHLPRASAAALRSWLSAHPGARVTLRPAARLISRGVPGWSATGWRTPW